MAHIAVLGLGNWGTAIARLWLLEGHKVTGWTIEQEVYESITMNETNEKYLHITPFRASTPRCILLKPWKVPKSSSSLYLHR